MIVTITRHGKYILIRSGENVASFPESMFEGIAIAAHQMVFRECNAKSATIKTPPDTEFKVNIQYDRS